MLKPLLILDLDNTLIFSYEKKKKFNIKTNDFYITNEELSYDFMCSDKYHTLKRPHLDEFLSYIQLHFNIAVWTAASEDYAKEICQNIGILNKIIFLKHCNNCEIVYHTMSSGTYVKNLNKLKDEYHLNKVLIIDDNAKSACNNVDNLIKIKPFFGDLKDKELLDIINHLDRVKDEDDLVKAHLNLCR